MDFDVISPKTTKDLLKAIDDNQNNNFRFGAGYTDLINQLKHKPEEGLTVINIAQLNANRFSNIQEMDEYINLGTLVTASDLIDSNLIKENFPVLYEAARSVASTQIRNSATIGGNICNASPSADMSGALVSLQAVCHILDTSGNLREEPLSSFILGVRKTSLKKNEILQNISIPKNYSPRLKSGFEKVGTRNSMEISIVYLAYHFQLNNDGDITDAGISCGAVAPIIPFAKSACDFLLGKNINDLSENDKEIFAEKVLEYATPISDIRASEWYRKEVLSNLCKTLFD